MINLQTILKDKSITATQKLILIDIALFPQILIYNKMSAEIASSIGVKQKDVKIQLDILQEMGIIESKIGYRTRDTQFSEAYKKLITE